MVKLRGVKLKLRIKIIKIQPEGSRPMSAKEFINGYSVITGESIT